MIKNVNIAAVPTTVLQGGESSLPETMRSLHFDSTPYEPLSQASSSSLLVQNRRDKPSSDSTKMTLSFWMKVSKLESRNVIFSASDSAGSNYFWLELLGTGALRWHANNSSSSVQGDFTSTTLFNEIYKMEPYLLVLRFHTFCGY